jgi:Na+/H+ antiporter NhaD/arsenite permease-like protein
MNIPLLVLALVFLLIAVRRIGRLRLPIWQIMGAGGLAVLAAGAITPEEALRAIDPEVMLFLFGMFVVGHALVASGYLYALAYRGLRGIRSGSGLLLVVLWGAALASALLMNDTLAIVGTPLVLRLAREHELDETLLLLALAFGVTLGSVLSPIGNPQNLLIATGSDLPSPFLTFLTYLGPPTLVNLALAYGWLRWRFRHGIHAGRLVHAPVSVLDPQLARLALISLLLVLLLVVAKIALVLVGLAADFSLSVIALVAAAPVLLFARRPRQLLRQLDWPTLIFFASMFVLMASVWKTGIFQHLILGAAVDLTQVPAILALSAGLSQLVSNVPLVALYLPLLQSGGADTVALMALAAGSTLAGNFLILGAASNVIIIQHAERHHASLNFWTFAAAGILLSLVNLAVYGGWLSWMGG